MKTRNNQPTADETLLNQSISRRSFVKRGAVAGAATVFGVSTSIAQQPVNTVKFTEKYTVTVPAGNVPFEKEFEDTEAWNFNGISIPAQSAMQNAILWLGDKDIAGRPANWEFVAIEGSFNSYTHHYHEFLGGGNGAGWVPMIVPGAGYTDNVEVTQGNGKVKVKIKGGGFTYTVTVAKAYAGATHTNAHAQ